MRIKRSAVRITLIAAAIALCLSGCTFREELPEAPELLPAAGVKEDIFTVFRGDVSVPRAIEAAVYPTTEELYFTRGGKIKEVNICSGRYVEAGEVLVTLDLDAQRARAGALQEEIHETLARGEIEDEIAELSIERLKNEAETLTGTEKQLMDIEIRRAERDLRYARDMRGAKIAEMQEELDALNAELENDCIRAPFAGRIGNVLSLAGGDTVTAYEPILYLADESRPVIKCEYLSDSVYNGANGGVYALIDGRRYDIVKRDMEYQTYLSNLLQGKTVYTTFDFAGGAQDVECGMYCAVMLESQYYPDELLIPANAVLSDAGGKYVYVMDENGEKHKRTVKIRTVAGAVYSIVTEGLQEGEKIYVMDK